MTHNAPTLALGLAIVLTAIGCDSSGNGSADDDAAGDTDTDTDADTDADTDTDTDTDSDTEVFPRFVVVDYIDLDPIERISRFRSSVGHDYSDDLEDCRSMKHYFQPLESADWSAVQIFAPFAGTVTWVFEEWAGTQVQIRPDAEPDYLVNLFHLSLDEPLAVDDPVTAGQVLGTHFGPETMSDVAVGLSTIDGWRLISYFQVMTDEVFAAYEARGLTAKSEAIISAAERDADPLTCDGETFTSFGSLEDWVVLD